MATSMRMRPTEYPHILWNIDKDLPCVAGTRLRVQDVVGQFQAGHSVEDAYPSYPRAQLYAALAYYFDHQAEMDALIAEHERSIEEWRRGTEARQGPSKAQALARARRLPV